MPSKRARRTQGTPTHWAHVALAVAHHSCVLLNTAKQDKNKRHVKSTPATLQDDKCQLLVVGYQKLRTGTKCVQ